jgi:hypothetical protein
MSIVDQKAELVSRAKLSEQAERYDDMAEYMRLVTETGIGKYLKLIFIRTKNSLVLWVSSLCSPFKPYRSLYFGVRFKRDVIISVSPSNYGHRAWSFIKITMLLKLISIFPIRPKNIKNGRCFIPKWQLAVNEIPVNKKWPIDAFYL